MPGAWRITADGRENLFPEDTWAVRVDDRRVWMEDLEEGVVSCVSWHKVESIEYSEFGFR